MMTEWKCDRCKKVLDNKKSEYNFLKIERFIPGGDAHYYLCEDCLNKIFEVLGEKHGNKQQ